MKIQIDRSLAIPIYTQIVGQLEFDIATGRLPSGAHLPSIRDLAHELKVAPMTIAQAYQELRHLGLVGSRPGAGTFVASFDIPQTSRPIANRVLQLRRILQRAIDEAYSSGFSEDEIKQGFVSLLTASSHFVARHSLALVGLFDGALRLYADDLERNLAGEGVIVDTITYRELEQHAELYSSRIKQAEIILTPIHQVQRLRELLLMIGIASDHPVLGLSLVLRPSVQQAVAALPAMACIGVVSTIAEFVVTMIQGIRAVHPLRQEPVVCLCDDIDGLRRLAPMVDALVYASGANTAIAMMQPLLPATVPVIEFAHTPDESAYQRIRQWLALHNG